MFPHKLCTIWTYVSISQCDLKVNRGNSVSLMALPGSNSEECSKGRQNSKLQKAQLGIVPFPSLHGRTESSVISVTLVFGKGSLIGLNISLSLYNLIMTDTTGQR
jgi:hypothetical protein